MAGPQKKKLTTNEERRLLLDAWKAIVEVQMHFNDMLMKVRNLGVTLLLAVFGAAAFSLQYELYLHLPFGRYHLATLIIAFGLIAWLSIWFMDRYYNKLLAGAVSKSTEIEDLYDEDWLGMTHSITHESRTLLGRTNAMKARNQLSLFLYLPILLMGLFYIVIVALWFQPAYVKGVSGSKPDGAEKASPAPAVAPAPTPPISAPVEAPSGGTRLPHR